MLHYAVMTFPVKRAGLSPTAFQRILKGVSLTYIIILIRRLSLALMNFLRHKCFLMLYCAVRTFPVKQAGLSPTSFRILNGLSPAALCNIKLRDFLR